MKQPKEIANYLEGDSQQPSVTIKESIKALKSYLEYGETKILARKYGVNLQRAYALLQGRLKIRDTDDQFIMACYDLAIRRKVKRFDKIKQLAQ